MKSNNDETKNEETPNIIQANSSQHSHEEENENDIASLKASYEKQIQELKDENASLKNELLLKKLNESTQITEDKFKILEEENNVLNKKLQCYIQENTLLRGKINSLSEIIKQNESFRHDMMENFDSNQIYIEKRKNERFASLYENNTSVLSNKKINDITVLDSLKELNDIVDTLTISLQNHK
jgi:hypothetical protein